MDDGSYFDKLGSARVSYGTITPDDIRAAVDTFERYGPSHWHFSLPAPEGRRYVTFDHRPTGAELSEFATEVAALWVKKPEEKKP